MDYVQFNTVKIAVLLEGYIVMNDLPRMADAFLLLFGLSHALQLIHTYDIIQKVLRGLDEGKMLKLKLLSLKKYLMEQE